MYILSVISFLLLGGFLLFAAMRFEWEDVVRYSIIIIIGSIINYLILDSLL